MPPLFRLRLKVNDKLLTRLRGLPERAQQDVRRRMQTELAPELQDRANQLLGADPGPVSEPFVFGNSPDAAQRSHDAYMAIVRETQGANDPNGHWIRTGIIETGFRVVISDRLRSSLIRVFNVQPKARYVYGPWQVMGHSATGWTRDFDVKARLLRKEAIRRILELWRQSVNDAARGEGA